MKYKIGQILTVTVVGIQPYGIFAKIDEDTQGLIHISEIEHGFVENLKELFEIGEKLRVMILDIDEYSGKISLSLRSLQETNQHPFSNKKRIPRYGKKTGLGFSSLEKKLPQWISESITQIKMDK